MACIGPAQTWVKDPEATLDYIFDWSDWLGPSDELMMATFTVTPGLMQVSDICSQTECCIWLSGGTDGNSYDVACYVETSGGRRDERTARILCQHR